jgi:hypothetical protein
LCFQAAWRRWSLPVPCFDGVPIMNTMKSLLLIAAITFLWFPACNYTVGECWYRDQGSETAGVGAGGVILPPSPTGGDGDFGDVPPRQPQDATNPPPECNIVTQSPCNEKCLADYESAAIVCGKIENEAQRTTCQDGAHVNYRSCRENCQRSANTPRPPRKDCRGNVVRCLETKIAKNCEPCLRYCEGQGRWEDWAGGGTIDCRWWLYE